MQRWQPRRERQTIDANAICEHDRHGYDVQRLRTAFKGLERRINICGLANFELCDLDAKRTSRFSNLSRFHCSEGIADIGENCQ